MVIRAPESRRANHLGGACRNIFIHAAQAAVLPQGDNQGCQIFVRNAALELAVERVGGGLKQGGGPVDVLDSFEQVRRLKECSCKLIGVVFEPLAGTEACTRWVSQLSAL